MIDRFSEDAFGGWSFCFLVLFCFASWCLAAGNSLTTGPFVSGACFLTGGMFECGIAHRRSVTVLCMLYNIRCNPMHPLSDAVCDSAG